MAGSGEEGHEGGIAGAVPAAYRHLVVDRGNETAALRTESFVTELKPLGAGVAYRYIFDPVTVGDPSRSCFEAVNAAAVAPEDLYRCAAIADTEGPPPQRYKAVRGRWTDAPGDVADGQDEDNLFGGYGAFLVAGDDSRAGEAPGNIASLGIPRIDDPSGTDFAFYGCRLLRHGNVIGFDEPLPLFTSARTANYASDYLFTGSGIYVEAHDIVHLHQPMAGRGDAAGRVTSGGYWVLGREMGPDLYWFSALKIPFGAAAAMPPGVIHNDVYLTGRYRAVYGARRMRAVRISSVILRDARDGAKMHMI